MFLTLNEKSLLWMFQGRGGRALYKVFVCRPIKIITDKYFPSKKNLNHIQDL
jgi:hypothetical protein